MAGHKLRQYRNLICRFPVNQAFNVTGVSPDPVVT